MKKYRVRIAPIVQEQIRDQILYIADESFGNALDWGRRLDHAIEVLGTLPRRHMVDEPASKKLGVTVRKMVFERTYLIHYVIEEAGAVVRIINFRHGKRMSRRNEP
jgi:hypothetical protein